MNILRVVVHNGPGTGTKEILSICPNENRWHKDDPKHLESLRSALKKEIESKISPHDKLWFGWERHEPIKRNQEPIDKFCKNIIHEVMSKRNEW